LQKCFLPICENKKPTIMKTLNQTLLLLFFIGFATLQAQDYIGKYHNIYPFIEGKAAVMKDGLWGFINEKGDEIVPLKFENVGDFSDGLATFTRNGLNGYLDASGREVIAPQFEVTFPFKNGQAIVAKNKKYGVIDKTGKTIIPLQYASISESDKHFVVHENQKAGVLNAQGKVLVPIQYNTIRGPQNGVFMASNDEKLYAMLNLQGKALTPFKYNFVGWSPRFGLWYVQLSSTEQGFLDLKGNEVIPPIYNSISNYNMENNFIIVRKNAQAGEIRYGVIDNTGKTVIPFNFKFLGTPNEGLLAAKFENNKFGYIDQKGTTIIQPEYDVAYNFNNGRAQVGNKTPDDSNLFATINLTPHKYGVVDRSGKLIVPIKYDDIKLSTSNYIAVNEGRYINSNYNEYLYTNSYSGSPGRWGLLDRNGNEIVKPKYHNFAFSGDGYASVNMGAAVSRDIGAVMGGKWGMIDSLGVEVIPPISDNILYVNELGTTIAKSGDEERMIDVFVQSYINNGLRAAQLNNYTDARNWFEKATQRGSGTGYGNLGFLYLQGMGVAKDEAKALQLLKKGAEREDAQSMFNLGWFYATQKQDKDEAIKWLVQAESAGHPQARPMLQQLANINMNNTPANTSNSRPERERERERERQRDR